jgi:hypothetical protein
MNALIKALKDCVDKGNRFALQQTEESTVVFSVTGGVSDIKIRLPFSVLGLDRAGEVMGVDYQAFTWESTIRTAGILIGAIEAMPEEAEPAIVIDADEWDGGGLLLSGTWSQKGRGRSKESIAHRRDFLIDAGILQEKTI